MRKNRKMSVSFNSPVVIWFTAVCFAALVLGWLTKGWTTNAFFSVYHSSLLSPLTYVRMIGHVFGHANWEHFIGNIMLLLIVGPLLEEKYGSSNLLFVILARCADFESGNLVKKAKSLVPLLVPLFISAFRRANDLAMAMEARCYRGGEHRTKMKPLHYERRDYIAYLVVLCYLAAGVFLGKFLPLLLGSVFA